MAADSTNYKDWVERAEEDLRAAKIILANDDGPRRSAATHIQQAVEKVLKAYLVFKTGHTIRSHSLEHLLGVCSDYDKEFGDYLDDDGIGQISDYYIDSRYPSDIPFELDESEVIASKEIAEEIFEKVVKKLK